MLGPGALGNGQNGSLVPQDRCVWSLLLQSVANVSQTPFHCEAESICMQIELLTFDFTVKALACFTNK